MIPDPVIKIFTSFYLDHAQEFAFLPVEDMEIPDPVKHEAFSDCSKFLDSVSGMLNGKNLSELSKVFYMARNRLSEIPITLGEHQGQIEREAIRMGQKYLCQNRRSGDITWNQ